jgi:hypothetical protein
MHGFVCYAEEKNCKNTCFIAVYLNGSSQNHISWRNINCNFYKYRGKNNIGTKIGNNM